MLYVPEIDDYSKIFTDEEVKGFVVINFSENLKSVREEQYLTKAAKLLYIFLIISDELEKHVQSVFFFDNCIHRFNVGILNI